MQYRHANGEVRMGVAACTDRRNGFSSHNTSSSDGLVMYAIQA